MPIHCVCIIFRYFNLNCVANLIINLVIESLESRLLFNLCRTISFSLSPKFFFHFQANLNSTPHPDVAKQQFLMKILHIYHAAYRLQSLDGAEILVTFSACAERSRKRFYLYHQGWLMKCTSYCSWADLRALLVSFGVKNQHFYFLSLKCPPPKLQWRAHEGKEKLTTILNDYKIRIESAGQDILKIRTSSAH